MIGFFGAWFVWENRNWPKKGPNKGVVDIVRIFELTRIHLRVLQCLVTDSHDRFCVWQTLPRLRLDRTPERVWKATYLADLSTL